MSWSIRSLGPSISLAVDGEGNRSIWGDAESHQLHPVAMTVDFDFLALVNSAACSWSIQANDAPDEALDPSGSGLLTRIRDNPESAQVAISLKGRSTVGMSIVLPANAMNEVWQLATIAQSSDYLALSFEIGVTWFRAESAQTATPTLKLFTEGEPYFSGDFSLALRRV